MAPFFGANSAKIDYMNSPLHGIFPIGMRQGNRAFFASGGQMGGSYMVPVPLHPPIMYMSGGNMTPLELDFHAIAHQLSGYDDYGYSGGLIPRKLQQGGTTRQSVYPQMVELGVINPDQVSEDSLARMPKPQFDDLFFNKFAPARARQFGATVVETSPRDAETIRRTRFDITKTSVTPKTFSQAFSEARQRGLDNFVFEGKTYTTNLGTNVRSASNTGGTTTRTTVGLQDRGSLKRGGTMYQQGGKLPIGRSKQEIMDLYRAAEANNAQNLSNKFMSNAVTLDAAIDPDGFPGIKTPIAPGYRYDVSTHPYLNRQKRQYWNKAWENAERARLLTDSIGKYQQGGEMQLPEETMGNPSSDYAAQLMMQGPGAQQQAQQQADPQQLAMAAAQGDQQAYQILVQMVGEQQAQMMIQQIQAQMSQQQAPQVMMMGSYMSRRKSKRKKK